MGGATATGGGAPGDGGGSSDGGSSSGGAGTGGEAAELEWLPSWATTIQNTETSNLPPSPGLTNNTLRQFVWPTVSGSQIRIQLSNEKGEGAVQIQKVHIARAKTASDPGNSNGQIDATTDAAFSFDGMPGLTIPAGETAWSDPLDFPLEEIKLTAISIQFGAQVPTKITGHPGARTMSYVASGDGVATESLSGAGTKERWYFINAIEVMAPSTSYAIALLGDSITDGYGILNKFARWPDFMTLAIKDDPAIATTRSVLNFGMGANNLTSSSADQDSGIVRFGRDVLKRDKIKWLIVMEGVNDIGGSTSSQTITSAYQTIIDQARAKGIQVYVSPITPMNAANGTRDQVNQWIRASDAYSPGVDFDIAIRDPGNPNNTQAAFKNDDLHPSEAGYKAMGESVDLSLFYDSTLEP